MAALRTTCSKCRTGFNLEEYPPGLSCPSCVPKQGEEVGTLILGDLIFESSDWGDNVPCEVETIHDAHAWASTEGGKHHILRCRGKFIDTSIERTVYVLLTEHEGNIRVAGTSQNLEDFDKEFVKWHNEGRTVLLLTVSQPHEGLTGVALAQLIPRHSFRLATIDPDKLPSPAPIVTASGLIIEEE